MQSETPNKPLETETPNGKDDSEARDRTDRIMIDNVFRYHQPQGNQADRYSTLRELARQFAHEIVKHCPPSVDRTVAISKLREVVYSANASIACNETGTSCERTV
jgi:hypothetical protein